MLVSAFCCWEGFFPDYREQRVDWGNGGIGLDTGLGMEIPKFEGREPNL